MPCEGYLSGNSTSTGKSKKRRHEKPLQAAGGQMVSDYEMEVFGFMTRFLEATNCILREAGGVIS